MKKFEGLRVPATEVLAVIQQIYCRLADDGGICRGSNCDKCLFDDDNIEQFKKWYKLQNK